MAKKKFDSTIYVVCGKDDYLVSKECEQIVAGLLEPDERQMSLLNVEADKVTASDVFDELRTLPFLAKKRVVLLKDADKFVTENRELLENYFDKPSNCGVLILAVSSWKSNTKLAKKISKEQLVQVEEINSYKVGEFVIDYAKREHNKKIDRESARMLGELIGNDPGRLIGEIDKLAVYDADKNSIDLQDILKLTSGGRYFDAFNVIDAMNSGDAETAIKRLRNMFDADKSSEYTVIGAFAYNFRQLFQAKALFEQGNNVGQVLKDCKVWSSQKDMFLKRVKMLSLDRLGAMLAELGKIDYGVKTGTANVRSSMEQLVIKCSLVNKKVLNT